MSRGRKISEQGLRKSLNYSHYIHQWMIELLIAITSQRDLGLLLRQRNPY